ncbi:hypothetical protein P9X05_27260, partial [Bacillus toyonensis]|nr:hypothetical protein [Bacillus toyonensis]
IHCNYHYVFAPESIEAYEAWQSGKITAVGAMRKYDIKRSSFYKLVKEYEAHEKTKPMAKNE